MSNKNRTLEENKKNGYTQDSQIFKQNRIQFQKIKTYKNQTGNKIMIIQKEITKDENENRETWGPVKKSRLSDV